MANPEEPVTDAESPDTTEAEQKGSMQPTPVLSLRDVVVYPHMVIPLFVGRDRSILALDQSMNVDKRIVLVTQRSAEIDEPSETDLFEVGTLATVLQLLKLPDGTTKVLVEGGERGKIKTFIDENGYFEDEGLYVTIEAQANWKVLLDGVIDGKLDGAHMLAGQPLAATMGYGTKAHIITPFSMDLNGNGITVSNDIWKEMKKNIFQKTAQKRNT